MTLLPESLLSTCRKDPDFVMLGRVRGSLFQAHLPADGERTTAACPLFHTAQTMTNSNIKSVAAPTRPTPLSSVCCRMVRWWGVLPFRAGRRG